MATATSNMPPAAQILSETLREQGRNHRWLARQVGISEGYVSKMCHGARPITDTLAVEMARALGIPASLLTTIRPPTRARGKRTNGKYSVNELAGRKS